MLLPVKNMSGTQVGEVEVSDAIFAGPVNRTLMHQALVRQLANARIGTHKTKTRGEVQGGGRKPWRQKGTGRARQGSIRAPNFVGGGTVFGPRPRSYTQAMPRKMRRAAIRSALAVKVGAGHVTVVDGLSMATPKTKEMAKTLDALGTAGGSVLIVTAQKDSTLLRSASNLPKVKMLLSGYLNIRDLLGYDRLLVAKDAIEQIESWLDAGVVDMADADPDQAAETGVEVAAEQVVDDVAVAEVTIDEVVEDETVEAAPEIEAAAEVEESVDDAVKVSAASEAVVDEAVVDEDVVDGETVDQRVDEDSDEAEA